ncbi:MAG TPA: VWA domain-containing protein [Pyrinomonadaceae bacterium]|jgi:VWFA-related protein|nr:VWA domain-containing protein [Pyrinomonadaceae bacterium]
MKLGRIRILSLLFSLLIPVVCLAQTPDQIETIRVESDLVDLKVSVVSLNSQTPATELQQKDFVVLEDGAPQDIAFFAAADTPFDLVLLLDLSGSTNDKLKLIRRSAKRFVEATRPIDRVSVVTFTDVAEVVCPLTEDRKLLRNSIDHIEKPLGGTRFWDSLRYVLAIFKASGNSMRRSAIVVMTDGVDNALPDVFGEGSQTSFDELLRLTQASETLVFPIYLDTEEKVFKKNRTPHSAFALAREQLGQLALVSGTRFYRADKLKDLDNVYEQVIGDLGRIYSIGYRPSNALRDGKWRSVTVQIHDRQDIVARTKQGYFSKNMPN